MAGVAVEVDYSAEGDLLWLGNGEPNRDSAQNVTFEPDFDAFFSDDGKCAGIYLFDAACILLPHLSEDSPTANFRFKELNGKYSQESDTLTIGNAKRTAESAEIADGLTIHYDETGKVVGLAVARARDLLLPLLREWRASPAV